MMQQLCDLTAEFDHIDLTAWHLRDALPAVKLARKVELTHRLKRLTGHLTHLYAVCQEMQNNDVLVAQAGEDPEIEAAHELHRLCLAVWIAEAEHAMQMSRIAADHVNDLSR